MDGPHSSRLQAWFDSTEVVPVDIHAWSYSVTTDGDLPTGNIRFDGFIKPTMRLGEDVSVRGEIYFVIIDRYERSFSGHPLFLAGEVRLNEVIDKPEDTFITMRLRLNEQYHNWFWKTLLLGTCSRGKSKFSLGVKLQRFTPADEEKLRDWEKLRNQEYERDRGLAAIEPGSVVWSVSNDEPNGLYGQH